MMNETTAKKTRRSKGEGTIYQNKKGRWIAKINRPGMTPKEFSAKTKAEAKAKLDEYKFLMQSGEVINLKATVEQYGMKYLHFKNEQVQRNNFKQSSYDRLECVYENNIKPYPISKVLMTNLTSSDIQYHIDSLQADYSYSTLKKIYLFFHAMINHGIKQKDFPKSYDPMANVELPDESAVGVKTKKLETIPDDAVEKIKAVALSYKPDGTLSYRYGPGIVFMLNTGMREGEFLAISKLNIEPNGDLGNIIHVTETVSKVKNRDKRLSNHYTQIITAPKYPRSKREIPLNSEAQMCLDIMLNTYGDHQIRSDLIVCTSTGNFPTHRNIQVTLDKILAKCNLPHYGVHALRHTFATKLLSKTSSHQDIKAVAELLGDDYKVVVRTYLHTDNKEKHKLVSLL